jgi:hypothetical protein
VWAGLPDPIGDRQELIAEDPEQEAVANLIDLLRVANPGGLAVTAKEICKKAKDEIDQAMQQHKKARRTDLDAVAVGVDDAVAPDFDDAGKYPVAAAYRTVFPRAVKIDSQQLGTVLNRFCGRIAGSRRIDRTGKKHNAWLWTVATVVGPADLGSQDLGQPTTRLPDANEDSEGESERLGSQGSQKDTPQPALHETRT